MSIETERALVERYRGTDEYADGYSDGLAGQVHAMSGEAYECGYRAGQRAADLFKASGFARTGDGEFSIRLGAA